MNCPRCGYDEIERTGDQIVGVREFTHSDDVVQHEVVCDGPKLGAWECKCLDCGHEWVYTCNPDLVILEPKHTRRLRKQLSAIADLAARADFHDTMGMLASLTQVDEERTIVEADIADYVACLLE